MLTLVAKERSARTTSPMTAPNSRQAAIETLYRLRREKTVLPVLFERICRQQGLAGADRALAMNLIYGVLRNYQHLEALMGRLCRQPVAKLHPVVYQALAVGLYQLFFLERIPDSAAVNETVKGAKGAGIPQRLTGFVNAVLRTSLRKRRHLAGVGNAAGNKQPILNHPAWLTVRWKKHFGAAEMEAFCCANNTRQPLSLRLCSPGVSAGDYLVRLEERGIAAHAGSYAPAGILLPDYTGTIEQLPGYGDSTFQVQGEAAQLCTFLLSPFTAGGRFLDACAGVGTKSAHLLELSTGCPSGRLVAVEPEPSRQKLFLANLTPTQRDRCTLVASSLEDFAATRPAPFDAILVDAPCSGTGIIGRQPDIRWRRRPEDIKDYARRQREILAQAASLLRPGGVLVYATCSLEPEENMEVVSAFLRQHPGFSLTDCLPFLPPSAAVLVRDRCFQPRPSQGLDGFFAARLVRESAND